jgi:hypothetical protein
MGSEWSHGTYRFGGRLLEITRENGYFSWAKVLKGRPLTSRDVSRLRNFFRKKMQKANEERGRYLSRCGGYVYLVGSNQPWRWRKKRESSPAR